MSLGGCVREIGVEPLCIRADGDYSQICLLNGRSELHDKSLTALTVVLPPDFVRCHRSCLVNLRHVRSLHSGSGSRYWLVMANGKELPVGRAHVAGLRGELALE
ncbi:LytTR family DNA-binding domain-containing protein [Luteimonas sp. 3794]|uniref:LytTR family DNA-binding domain-containing protein n=1 Tax=Luteimonas sp. 3794 TaxID=2817730 RepID=UPI00286A6D59|nr:LytTR family DNA-binding domain-containing protein [Luteimonas sp. 3794]